MLNRNSAKHLQAKVDERMVELWGKELICAHCVCNSTVFEEGVLLLEAAGTSTTAGNDSSWLHARHSHFEVASLKLKVPVPEFAKHCIRMYLGICTHHLKKSTSVTA